MVKRSSMNTWRGLLGAGVLWLGLGSTAQASFSLESMGIVLEEAQGRTNFTIKNTSSEPILLVSKLEDLDGQKFSQSVLVSPPITRIDAGQSQQVNFVLKQGVKLPHEVMLKASFQGVGQAKDNAARMPVKQSIGMILQPASVNVSKTPWEDLVLHAEGNELVMRNTGKHVVRLASQMQTMPGRETLDLGNYYVMSGEERRFKVKARPDAVNIVPLSRYGFKLPEVKLTVGVKR